MTTASSETRLRRLAAVVAVAVLVILAWWAIIARSRDRAEPRSPSGTASAKPMAGMSGMTTGTNGSVRLTADQIRQFGITFGTA